MFMIFFEFLLIIVVYEFFIYLKFYEVILNIEPNLMFDMVLVLSILRGDILIDEDNYFGVN
jgi:hypothetical protein